MDVREKKHRLPESAYRGQKTVSFTACIKDRRKVFTAPVVEAFVPLLEDALTKHRCIAPLYCFMPDHLHLLIFGREPSSRIKLAMDAFKEVSGEWFHEHCPSVHWQDNYHDHIVRHSDDLAGHVRYIMANPVRAGLVGEWQEYSFTGSIGIELGEYLHNLDESRKFGLRY